jgi:hypothetical protein
MASERSTGRRTRERTPPEVRRRPDAIAWFSHGIGSGVLGTAVAMLVFLVVDLSNGRLFWTPARLGSALFTQQRLRGALGDFDPWAHAELIVGYLAVHGAFFVGFGAIAAFLLMTAERLPRSPARVVGLTTAALFAANEAMFVALGFLSPDARLLDDLGWGVVALANLLASAAMAVMLTRHSGERAPRRPEYLPSP